MAFRCRTIAIAAQGVVSPQSIRILYVRSLQARRISFQRPRHKQLRQLVPPEAVVLADAEVYQEG